MADFNTWKNAVLGQPLDVDGHYGQQCVDTALSWALTCFPGHVWSELIPPVDGAKDMYDHYNSVYWDRVANDHNNPNQVPPAGALAIFAASPEAGYTSTYANPYGHVGVVDHTSASYVYLVQQDAGLNGGRVMLTQRPWRYTRLIGWLIPKANVGAPTVPTPPAAGSGGMNPSVIGKTLYLHPVTQWRVYRVGAQPSGTNAIGFLRPNLFTSGLPAPKDRGLTYRIEGVSKYPNTVTIRTSTYGLVDIYVDSDGEIL